MLPVRGSQGGLSLMGKTPKPLKIYVHPAFKGEPWVAELREKGHDVTLDYDSPCLWEADLILAPQAARFLPGMEKFLEDFIKGARKVKYPKEPR